ncbi:MAG: DUF481 domain-containing protein [Planctomycetes bacterium]|nr:DUF481 domain-containing protein [Planctomycetota bacterium]MCW8135318.1 DUF481 domain-containing protein [Planctomycetota bacterium]
MHNVMRFLFVVLLLVAGAWLSATDKLTTTNGDVLVGTFDKLEAGHVHFTSPDTGTVKIAVEKVARLELDGEREVSLRTAEDIKQQQKGKLVTRDGKLVFVSSAGELSIDNLGAVKGVNETLPDERPLWEASLLGTFSMTEGNTDTYSLGYRFDIKRHGKRNFQTLFGRGSYFEDTNLLEDQVRERRHDFGYLYRYIFDFRLTIEVTEDLSFNEFAGYRWRSITGVGPGYQIIKEDRMWWNVAAHAIYVYEDLIFGGEDRGYFGARARTEFDWVGLNETLHINFKSEVLFDFDIIENVVVNSALLAEYKFGGYFSAGLLVEHSFDNVPTPGFFRNDFRFTFTIGISWSGRWV